MLNITPIPLDGETLYRLTAPGGLDRLVTYQEIVQLRDDLAALVRAASHRPEQRLVEAITRA